MPTPKTRARKSREAPVSVREQLLKSEKALMDADDDVEDGVEHGSEEGEHDADAEPSGDAFEGDDDDDSQPGSDDIELEDQDTDEDPENGDLDSPEDGGDDAEGLEDLDEKRGEPTDDHDDPKQGPEEDGEKAAARDDDEELDDEDETAKSRRLIFSMRKALNHLAGMHKSNPKVRKEALLAKAMGGGRLSGAECTELDRLNRGLPAGPALRHKVNKGAVLSPALQKAHTTSEGFRALAANLAKSHAALADEVEATRDTTHSQNLALAKGLKALGELSVRTAERQDELVGLLNKALRQPAHQPRSAGVGYIDKSLGGQPVQKAQNPAKLQKALQEMAKANPLRAADYQMAEYALALNGALPAHMQPIVADHITKSRDGN